MIDFFRTRLQIKDCQNFSQSSTLFNSIPSFHTLDPFPSDFFACYAFPLHILGAIDDKTTFGSSLSLSAPAKVED
jgi:hypothetical protein